MSIEPEKYCFDTDCFIEPWNKFYSYKSHKSYWEDFVLSEIRNKNVIILKEVYDELGRKDDDLFRWLKGHKSKDSNIIIVDVDRDLVRRVQSLLEKYQKLISSGRGRSSADPFLIEYARRNNFSVVTLENASNNLNKPKIPDVCNEEGVKCINFHEYIDRIGVSFRVERESGDYSEEHSS